MSFWFIEGKFVYNFRNFFKTFPKTNYCRKNIFHGTLVPLYQENEKLGQSDRRGRNDPGDNDPKKVTKLNMKCSLVLNTAIYMYINFPFFSSIKPNVEENEQVLWGYETSQKNIPMHQRPPSMRGVQESTSVARLSSV